MAIAFIGIGSNIGKKEDNCHKAIEQMQFQGLIVLARSSLYKTAPIGFLDQEWFINCAIKAHTDLSPFDLLFTLKFVEREMGRKEAPKWGPRLIDLDILLYDNLIIKENELSIPHMHLAERLFMLEPLVEIDSTLIHPVLDVPLQELYAKMKLDRDQIVNRI